MGCCAAKTYNSPKEIQTKWHTQYFERLPSQEGKVMVITGCTTGTGFCLARDCAKKGAKVLMLNRDSDRATAALEAVTKEAPDAKVIHIACDLMEFAAVRAAAEKVKLELGDEGIDVLCNNAGIMATPDEATKDGYDTQMQTNHLSHFLLTEQLWPELTKAAEKKGEARVVNQSSVARNGPALQRKYFEKNGGNLGGDASGAAPFTGPRWERYQQTKLANLAFTLALRDRLNESKSTVKALCSHPGVAATNLQVTTYEQGGVSGRMANFSVSQSADDGSIGILMCCCDPNVQSGGLYGPTGQMGMAGMAKLLPQDAEEKRADTAARQMLWETSEAATGVKFSP